MASSIVVKVKYEDTLRRFNVHLHEDQQMGIDIGALRAKICSLFNLAAESDLKLTYVDEDLDMVALVDQDDLCDVVRQGLNPLRINVELNTVKSCSSNARTSGTSTPRPENMNTSAADHLKSVHPLREALSKLSAEASSKAASSSRVLADLVDSITKASQTFLNANSSPKSGFEDATSWKKADEKYDASFTGKTTLGMSTSGLGDVLGNVGHKTTECINDDGKKKHGTQGPIFHKGVCCDGCGVLPINGPRFKSKVKEDYDLCKNCFSLEGNEADYMRIDFPAPYRHPWSFKGHLAQFGPRLDSHFVRDVNVVDGTIMTPKTFFTKIWRMRNNGNLTWAHGTQLVWIGGDKFSRSDNVEIEVPSGGLCSNDEVDVAVDFVAPESPGRYIAHWMMASPNGKRFGQRVWVAIEVDASNTSVPTGVVNSMNLNIPPNTAGENKMDVETSINLENASCRSNEIEKPLEDEKQSNLSDIGIEDDFQVISACSSSSPPHPIPEEACSLSSYPTIEVVLPNTTTTSPLVNPSANVELMQHDDVEVALLKELEEMGFKLVSLNKEVLRRNDYDLEWSLEELCGFSKFDLLVEELQEMGFVDKEKNKKVLAKHNGSLIQAVMELIADENA